jgi:hypothetical protein
VNDAPGTAPDIQHLVDRTRELKRALIDYAENKRFDRYLQPIATRASETRDPRQRQAAWISGLDDFVMTFKFPDGATLIDRFLGTRKDLDEADRTLLESWRESLESVFEVAAKDGGRVTLLNLLDDLPYVAYAPTGPDGLRTVSEGDFVLVRLAPLTAGKPAASQPTAGRPAPDNWTISGLLSGAPNSDQKRMVKIALQLASTAPGSAFRNPELLKRSHDAMGKDRERFVGFFGSDEVIMETKEAENRINAYRLHAKKAARAESALGDAPASYFAKFGLPRSIQWSDTIGVIYDETSGLEYAVDYGKARELFADPKLASDKAYARLLQAYLKDESVSPMPVARLATSNPETADEVFRTILKRPDFTWSADGEALLHQYKGWYYEKERHPSLTVVGDRLRELADLS